MSNAPLIRLYGPDDALAWEADGPRSVANFLSDVADLADSLPDLPSVLNLLSSRYQFIVGFAAAMMRGQVTLLPQTRAPQTLRRIAGEYGECYALTDAGESVDGLPCVTLRSARNRSDRPLSIPQIPLDQHVAVAFTSGSTGQPTPNRKTWGALVSVARATGSRFGLQDRHGRAVVATVPHQHMFGLEASVMLPIQHGLTMHAGRPLFPEDVRGALEEVAGPSVLITTPLHLRACVTADLELPHLHMIVSATSPLARELASEAEKRFHAAVNEIFGFAEAGSVASRRTILSEEWQMLDGVTLTGKEPAWSVQAAYLPHPIRFPDRITVTGQAKFRVLGRTEDQINIAGHRASLSDLTRKLLEIDGVQDGAFYIPDISESALTRLSAAVVAPGKTQEDIRRALRLSIDPAFLPRPLLVVPKLPRNETGKLPLDALRRLVEQYSDTESAHEL
ncbi:MAG TPA: AMP-binding protein [Nitrospira sp.]|nr:AMP-binding protein [Nitrospira sp.]